MTDRTIPRQTIEAMVRTIDPDLQVREASPADRGHTAVYRLAVDGVDDDRDLVLKATHDGDPHGIPAEARLLALLGERTSIPVPRVLGAVDDHEDLPAPFFLMTAMSGEALPQREVVSVPDDRLRRLAHETGRHLAELHGLDVVEEFGHVTCEPSPPLRGGRPPTDGDELVVSPTRDSWQALVRAWIDGELDGAELKDLTPRVETTFEQRIDDLDGPFAPVLGRIDHGLHNLLVDDGVAGMIDWAFTLASTAGYDLATVAYVLAGGPSTALPDAPDRRELVRTAMLEGYSEIATVPQEYRDHRELYELLAHVRATNHLDTGLAHVREENVEAAAEGTRTQIRRLLDGLTG